MDMTVDISCLQNAHFYIQKGPLFEIPCKAFKLDRVSFSTPDINDV